MDRKNAPKAEKWDTTKLVKNDAEFEEKLKKLETLGKELETYRGKLTNHESYKKFVFLAEEYGKLATNLGLFLSLEKSLDNGNSSILAKSQKLHFLSEEQSKMLAFSESEKKKFSNSYIKELAADADLAAYRRDILDIERQKKHILPEDQEKLLAGAGASMRNSTIYRALTTNELVFEPITMPNGKKQKIDENNISIFGEHKNAKVRKDAKLSILNGYKKHNLSLAELYLAKIKADDFFSTTAKYESTFVASLEEEEIPLVVYKNLIDAVHKNLPLFYRYANIRKKLLGGKIAITDFNNSLFRLPNKKYSYKEAVDVVKQATSVFGADYTEGLEKLTSGGFVDVWPSQNKRKGAFETADDEGNIFVMLNHVSNFDSVDAMAHEFGHAMHTYYSTKAQPYALRDYEIFVAEIASTVNEILLLEYMTNQAKTPKVKMAYLEKLLKMAYAAIFRQAMFAEFEEWAHDAIHNKIPTTYADINKKYISLVRKYFGKNVKIYPEFQYEWSRIPHFYTPFYVYKYATGMLAAMLIVESIKKDKSFVQKYKQFLSAGSSDTPTEILKLAGVDFEKPETFNKAFALYKSWIKQMEEAAKKC